MTPRPSPNATPPLPADALGTAGTADASLGLRLGYLPRDRQDQFICSTVLEGGSSTCILGKKATCSIKDGRLFNDPVP